MRTGLNEQQLNAVRSFVLENRMDAPAYKAGMSVRPFLQGQRQDNGWVLIKFFTDDIEKIDAYIGLLNSTISG